MNGGGLRKVGNWWEGDVSGIRFPFGCSHTHSHHCRQCRGKSPLRGAPEKDQKKKRCQYDINNVREAPVNIKRI